MKQVLHKIIAWSVGIIFLLIIDVQGLTPLRLVNYGSMLNAQPTASFVLTDEQNLLLRKKLADEEINLIKEYSSEYGIDYRLILAIIEQESQFDNEAQSSRGATGLMQLMPVTSAEVAENLDLKESTISGGNIKSGIFYFAKLSELFNRTSREDQLSLTLAAYNAGPSRIYDAQELAAYMGENPSKWSAIQKVLPLLSKRYYSLHQSVWGDGKPPNGYFGSWRQTITYVQNTLKIYQDYVQNRS